MVTAPSEDGYMKSFQKKLIQKKRQRKYTIAVCMIWFWSLTTQAQTTTHISAPQTISITQDKQFLSEEILHILKATSDSTDHENPYILLEDNKWIISWYTDIWCYGTTNKSIIVKWIDHIISSRAQENKYKIAGVYHEHPVNSAHIHHQTKTWFHAANLLSPVDYKSRNSIFSSFDILAIWYQNIYDHTPFDIHIYNKWWIWVLPKHSWTGLLPKEQYVLSKVEYTPVDAKKLNTYIYNWWKSQGYIQEEIRNNYKIITYTIQGKKTIVCQTKDFLYVCDSFWFVIDNTNATPPNKELATYMQELCKVNAE